MPEKGSCKISEGNEVGAGVPDLVAASTTALLTNECLIHTALCFCFTAVGVSYILYDAQLGVLTSQVARKMKCTTVESRKGDNCRKLREHIEWQIDCVFISGTA